MFLPETELLEMAPNLSVWEVWESDRQDSRSPASGERKRVSKATAVTHSAAWWTN